LKRGQKNAELGIPQEQHPFIMTGNYL